MNLSFLEIILDNLNKKRTFIDNASETLLRGAIVF